MLHGNVEGFLSYFVSWGVLALAYLAVQMKEGLVSVLQEHSEVYVLALQ